MERNNETSEGLLLQGWMAMRRWILYCLALDAALGIILGFSGLLYAVPITFGVPILAGSYVAGRGKRACDAEDAAILKEAPSVIGMMVMSMQVRPSIEAAIRFASSREGVLAGRLRASAWKVLAKESEGMEDAVVEVASSLSERNDSVRQSLHLLLSTAHESSPEGIQRLLDRASKAVIDGVREATERYVSSLATPTMVLFAVGILVPVLLFTMIPLQTLGTLDLSSDKGVSPAELPILQLGVLVLFVLPAGTLVYARTVVARNPVGGALKGLGLGRSDLVVLGSSTMAACFIASVFGPDPYLLLLAGGTPLALHLATRTRKAHHELKDRRRWDSDLVSGLYQVANRLASGTALERSMEQTAPSSGSNGFFLFAQRVLHRTRVSRMTIEEAIQTDVIRESFPLHWNAMMTVAAASDADPVSAGKVAFSLASNLDDLRTASRKIDDSLRGTVEMMRASSAFFAPLILGVTVGLFGLLQRMGTLSSGADTLVLVTGLYVLELAAIISYFTARLRGSDSWEEVLYDFGTRAPIALIIFIGASALSRSVLTQLL